jgi:hypothetical protein
MTILDQGWTEEQVKGLLDVLNLVGGMPDWKPDRRYWPKRWSDQAPAQRIRQGGGERIHLLLTKRAPLPSPRNLGCNANHFLFDPRAQLVIQDQPSF